MKKRWMLMVIVLTVLPIAGMSCNSANIIPEQLKALASSVEQVNTKLDTYQAAIDSIPPMLQTFGVPAETVEKIKTELAKANREIDAVQPQVAAITEAVKNTPTTGDNIADFIDVLQAANTASAPFNPYAAAVTGVLGLVATLLGIFAKKKAAEAQTATLKYQAHKSGVELTMKEMSASIVPEVKQLETKLYTNIGDARASLSVK